jgi:nickel transport protein
MKKLLIWISCFCFVLPVLCASAHKVKCFAAVEGRRISGYAWMDGGGRPENAAYKVVSPGGDVLYRGTTNEKGEFSFVPTNRCDHIIIVNAGAGHMAKFRIESQRIMPADRAEADSERAESVSGPVETSAAPESPGRNAGAGRMQKMVRDAVSKEIVPLRKELAEFKDRRRVQDIVAGLGYIAGLAGLAFFFLGARRKDK